VEQHSIDRLPHLVGIPETGILETLSTDPFTLSNQLFKCVPSAFFVLLVKEMWRFAFKQAT